MDKIESMLEEKGKTRRQIIKKLKSLGLITVRIGLGKNNLKDVKF